MELVQAQTLERWTRAYAQGTHKDYPSTDLVRLNHWFFKNPGQGRLLEVGCGTGVNTLHMVRCGYGVDAVDICDGALDMVRNRFALAGQSMDNLRLQLVTEGSRELPFADDSFDFAIAISVLSLLGCHARVESMLAEVARVLRPSGKLIVDINDAHSDFSGKHEYLGDDVFLHRSGEDDDEGVPMYCPATLEAFQAVVEPFFEVEDTGWSGHEYMGSRINEWILCCRNRG